MGFTAAATLALLLGAAGSEAKGTGVTKEYVREGASPQLPLDHPRLRPSEDAPVEQVHLTAVGPNEPVLVSFVTTAPQDSVVEFMRVDSDGAAAGGALEAIRAVGGGSSPWVTAVGTSQVYSALNFYTPTNADGSVKWNETHWGSYQDARDFYTSSHIHSVPITGLAPGAAYAYRIPPMSEQVFHFVAPKAVDPKSKITFGVVGDLGQTQDSLTTMDGLGEHADSLDGVLLIGDLSYSDGYGPRWDSFGRLAQPVFSGLLSATVGGNHEFDFGEAWVGLRARWPAPPKPTHLRGGATDAPLYYSYEVGPVHVLALNSYMDGTQGGELYDFVDADLKSVDRARTPWVIAFWHTPWYTSSKAHTMAESQQMRDGLETLMYSHRVNLVFNGHVHAYERTANVYKGELDACGPAHHTIGDGGNREGPALPWAEPQPEWSLFREASFGFGTLELDGAAETATWRWFRNQDGGNKATEEVVYKLNADDCNVKAVRGHGAASAQA